MTCLLRILLSERPSGRTNSASVACTVRQSARRTRRRCSRPCSAAQHRAVWFGQRGSTLSATMRSSSASQSSQLSKPSTGSGGSATGTGSRRADSGQPACGGPRRSAMESPSAGGSLVGAARTVSQAARNVSDVKSSAVPRSLQRRTKYPYTTGRASSYSANSAPGSVAIAVAWALTILSSRLRPNSDAGEQKIYRQCTGGRADGIRENPRLAARPATRAHQECDRSTGSVPSGLKGEVRKRRSDVGLGGQCIDPPGDGGLFLEERYCR